MRLRVNQRRGGVLRTSASTTLRLGRSAEKSQGFKLDSGDPTVQDYRGASGNVAMVELGTRLAIERARTVTLHLKLARWSSIPTVKGSARNSQCARRWIVLREYAGASIGANSMAVAAHDLYLVWFEVSSCPETRFRELEGLAHGVASAA